MVAFFDIFFRVIPCTTSVGHEDRHHNTGSQGTSQQTAQSGCAQQQTYNDRSCNCHDTGYQHFFQSCCCRDFYTFFVVGFACTFHDTRDCTELTSNFFDHFESCFTYRLHCECGEQERQHTANQQTDDYFRIQQVDCGQFNCFSVGYEQSQSCQSSGTDRETFTHSSCCVTNCVQFVCDFSYGVIQTGHFCDTTSVVSYGTVSVNCYCDTCCCQHTYCGQSDTVQTAYCVSDVDTNYDQQDCDACRFHTYSQTGNDCCCRTCFGLVCDFLNVFVVTGCVNFCHNTDNLTNYQTSDNCDSCFEVTKQFHGQSYGADSYQYSCCVRTCFQSFVRVGFFVTFNEECTDDRRDDTCAGQQQREQSAFCFVVDQTQCDCGDDGTNIGFEQVSTHTSYVTYVVAYVVSDNRGVTRVIFRDTSFYFTYQVSTNVGCFCVDTAANTTEQRDGGSTQGEAEQDVSIACECIDCAYACQTQTNYAHTHNCTAGECDRQGFVHTACSSCVCSSNVCICCYFHTEETCQCGEDRTTYEADCCRPVYTETDCYEQNRCEDNQNFVFCAQESVSTFSDGTSDFFHSVCTFVHSIYFTSQYESKQQSYDTQNGSQID